ncbi:MAG: hypothetical protein WBA17_18530 [Saprospiraceae bacterium]
MNANERDELLRRYRAAETTLAEEQRLRDYFARQPAGADLPPEAVLFGYYTAAGRGRLPTAAETRIRARLRSRPRRYLLRGLAAAATILLLVLALNGWQRTHLPAISTFPMAETTGESTVDWSRYEITDPEEAARVLVKSLRTVSQEMATGKEKAAPLRQLKLLSDPLDTAGLPQ